MYINKFFAFSFGGKNDFGKEMKLNEDFIIDFSSKPCGVGFAIRGGQEADFSNKPDSILSSITVSADIDLTIEFKTEQSNGAPEVSEKLFLTKGENNTKTLIPKVLSSDLKEIVFFFERKERDDDVQIKFNKVITYTKI